MYYNDHGPPHFYVRYGGDKALIAIDTLTVLEGRIPPRALGLIVEWGTLHRDELLADWSRSRQLEPLKKIDPLA
ncbi:MAG: DUF4160 domain-containing protein [Acidobacteriia bacterium]|nr:DUF4160 domain-containing protein [Terriglobia bacterium]